MVRKELGVPVKVLVTGDVAYSAQPSQYETAKNLLNDITITAGCSETDVWLVPGNHDVSWATIQAEDFSNYKLHQDFRLTKNESLTDFIKKHSLKEKLIGSASSRLKDYIEFADHYSMGALSWFRNDFSENGVRLKFVGTSSMLLSDMFDQGCGRRRRHLRIAL